MTKPRHSINPAKVKYQVSALDGSPATAVLERRLRLRRRLTVALLCVLSSVLLAASFAPFDLWPLAYVAMVPWMLALSAGTRRRWALLWGWLAGLLFWAGMLYWLWWITLPGYFATVAYLSAYWFIAAFIVRAAIRQRMPMALIFPLVWVALEFARAHVMSGFPWFFLAHSQYRLTRLIQVTDLTGTYGVSFFVGMVNGAVVDLFYSPLLARTGEGPWLTRRIIAAGLACLLTALVLLGYGTWRLGQQTTSEGPIIGVAQCAFRNTLHSTTGREKSPREILEAHLNLMAAEFKGRPIDLAVMPETVVPEAVNPAVLDLDPAGLSGPYLRGLLRRGAVAYTAAILGYDTPEKRDAMTDAEIRRVLEVFINGLAWRDGEGRALYWPGVKDHARQVVRMANELSCPVLAGALTWHRNDEPAFEGDEWHVRNSALLFTPEGVGRRLYSKMHPVPFSEFVPFKQSWPALHRMLRWFVPRAMSQIEPGTDPAAFELARGDRAWHVATPICYEGTFARVCRRLVRAGDKDKLILVNLSNDGWFVYQTAGGVNRPSTEQAQHLAAYVFRAIENRVPVVRAVNTGVSASIDSCGRIVAVLQDSRGNRMVHGTLLLDGAKKHDREYLPGHGPKVLVDSRVTPYSRAGDVFAVLVCAAAVGATGVTVWKRIRRGKGKAR